MKFLTEPLVAAIVFYFFYRIFELFARRKERLAAMEKMTQSPAFSDYLAHGSNYESFLPSNAKSTFTSLRAGCLLLGLGLGLLTGLFIRMGIKVSEIHIEKWEQDISYGACILFFGGFGLIVSYIIEQITRKKQKAKE